MQVDGDSSASRAPDGPSRSERRDERRERRRRRSRRFLEKYEQRRQGNANPIWRPIRITTGVLLVLAGIAIGWLPGPGFVILALPGAFLIASEVRRAALLMDHLENVTVPRVHRVHARLRGGPKHEWVEEDPEFWADWCDAHGRELPDAPGQQPDAPVQAQVSARAQGGATRPSRGELAPPE
jgi:hypothetical protein